MSKTIRRYSSDFKHDAVQYVESHPDISMELSIFVQCLNPQNYAASANGCSRCLL